MVYVRINQKATGEKLRSLREENGYKIKDLTKVLSLSCVQTIYSWESGVNIPSIENLLVLQELYQTSVQEMLVYDYVQEEKPKK